MAAIKNLVIVGGGTAGWMAAAALTKLYGKLLTVTLVESDEIGTIGVGEATIPTMVFFHQLLGISETEFLTAVQGTFKLGIKFENWRAQDKHYLHAFGRTGADCWAAGFPHFWLRGLELGIAEDFGSYCFERKVAEHLKFAHMPNNGLNYAFHIDASRYAKFLREFSERYGVNRIEGIVKKVNKDCESGFIKSISLASGEVIEGDFFFDCSGMRAVLIEQALHTGYEDWSHWLPCDRAIAVQTESVRDPVPYTRSIAHSVGWQWQIPLRKRTGNGYVYCSKFIADEDAKQVLIENVEGKLLTEPKLIQFRTGRRLKQWNKNCLAVGLSGGFLEPLESTSIHLIQQNIVRFMRMFPAEQILQSDIDEFNSQAKFDLEHIRDFIILHYCVTERDDSDFWVHCKNMELPESLLNRINLFKETGRMFRDGNELFDDSWLQVMIGQGLMPKSYNPLVDTMSRHELEVFLSNIRRNIDKKLSELPAHSEYLNNYPL